MNILWLLLFFFGRHCRVYLWTFIKYFDWQAFANWICCCCIFLHIYLLLFGHTFALWVTRSSDEYDMLIIENINIQIV